MRALRLTALDGPDALELADVPDPPAADGMALVEVHAAGVSFPDLLLTRGEYQIRPEPPFVPGIESAGVVREAPPGSGLEPGDRVCAVTMLGGFAELVAAPVATTLPIPDGMGFDAAAGLVMNFHTALFALERRAALRAGETVLVHGAGGGVGTAALQIARGLGARAIAVASTQVKRDAALATGAELALDGSGDWVAAAREATGGRGADVVVDPVGGEVLRQSIRALAPEGRLLVIGFASGEIPEVAVNRLLLRNVSLMGVNWGGFLAAEPAYARIAADRIAELHAAGAIAPVVGERYPLERGADALHALADRRAVGKPVIVVRP